MKNENEKKKKYEPLKKYLENTREDSVCISFSEISRIIDDELPESAYKYKIWWSNGGQYHNYAWLDAGWKVDDVTEEESVVFRKMAPENKTYKQLAFIDDMELNLKGKYAPLEIFLRKSEEDIITLTYSEIEKTINSELPDSAYKYNTWWSNGGHEHAGSWMNAGFRVKEISLSEKIIFEKNIKKDTEVSFFAKIKKIIKKILSKAES